MEDFMGDVPARVSVAYDVIAAVPLPGEAWMVMGFHDNASERYVVKRVSSDGTEGEGQYRSAIDGASNLFLVELAGALGAVVGPAGSVVVARGDREILTAQARGFHDTAKLLDGMDAKDMEPTDVDALMEARDEAVLVTKQLQTLGVLVGEIYSRHEL
jgi:hypothetical protein